MIFHASSFHLFGKQMLTKLYHQYDAFNVLTNTSFAAFMNKKLIKASNDGRSFKHLYLNSTPLFEYEPSDKEKQWAEKMAAREKRLVFRV